MNTLQHAAIAYIRKLFQEQAGSHDLSHSMRVYRMAMTIADLEPDCDREVVALAALLHDADDPKLFDTRDNANCRAFLRAQGMEEQRIEEICRVINGVSFSHNRGRRPETPEGKIVQDADRLDAMGAVGIARTFAYGGEHGRSLQDSARHFYEKLLLLRDEMNTETGKALAEERHRFLRMFIERFEAETGKGC